MITLPAKFKERMKRLLRDEYDEYKKCLDKNHAAGIRVNSLKIEPEKFVKEFPIPINRIPFIKNGFYYSEDDKPSRHPYYYAGMYYIQEPSAMSPASLLPVKPGERVLDLCAAPGGKSTELGARLCGKGVLVSNDISNSRAKALLKNIEMSGIKNAVVLSEPPDKLADVFEGWFDKILVDAPCSGEGMFRKSQSIIKNWEEYGVEYYNKLQKEILPHAVRMLKPGGYLLYSTCTFSPEENEGTAAWLLSNHEELKLVPALTKDEGIDYSGFEQGRPEWIEDILNDKIIDKESICSCIRLWPHKINGEGHFVALFKKSMPKKIDEPYMQADDTINKANKKSYTEPNVSDEARQFLSELKMKIDFNQIMVREDKLYMLPEGIKDLDGLRILRSGLFLGEQKKGRFEPSQALASALKADEYHNIYNLDKSDENVIRYLKCESIELKKEVKPGWVLVCVDGYPLGWGRMTGGHILKNKYFPGWRML